jgi:mono/diheme cytochrome c family protein
MKAVFQPATVLLILVLLVTGCSAGQSNGTTIPQQQPTNTAQTAGIRIPNLSKGEKAWTVQQCNACHGPLGLGGIGPALASTPLEFSEFLNVVRAAMPPKPAYSEEVLSEDMAYNIYAWVRTQQLYTAPSVPTDFPTIEPVTPEDAMGMTIWTARKCNTCHGVFAQGGPKAPTLAGLNYPVEEELARMRQASSEIKQHSADNIDDPTFEKLYRWLQAGCSYTNDCAQ